MGGVEFLSPLYFPREDNMSDVNEILLGLLTLRTFHSPFAREINRAMIAEFCHFRTELVDRVVKESTDESGRLNPNLIEKKLLNALLTHMSERVLPPDF